MGNEKQTLATIIGHYGKNHIDLELSKPVYNERGIRIGLKTLNKINTKDINYDNRPPIDTQIGLKEDELEKFVNHHQTKNTPRFMHTPD